ncbi:Imm70 family immunity protein [Massilia rubra]|uniref:Uncharacterized protein n=1 Tax=Massilia rubra TaxID=2607910 RepID=A0ABX0LS79_9BURK|nr:Imm70 family immunity protein [Massilia rubra]NHZ34309.1 hypothetical protein [Massilia rubra]
MAIAFKQGSVITQIGPGGVLHSLLSTVAVHLENGRWGSNFPFIMHDLYQGSVSAKNADAAYLEMQKIKAGLASLSAANVVWDIEDLAKRPPWGSVAGPHVTSMANYYVTSNGLNLVDEVIGNLESLREFGGTLDIISCEDAPRF